MVLTFPIPGLRLLSRILRELSIEEIMNHHTENKSTEATMYVDSERTACQDKKRLKLKGHV